MPLTPKTRNTASLIFTEAVNEWTNPHKADAKTNKSVPMNFDLNLNINGFRLIPNEKGFLHPPPKAGSSII
jgi:hypothetical protein